MISGSRWLLHRCISLFFSILFEENLTHSWRNEWNTKSVFREFQKVKHHILFRKSVFIRVIPLVFNYINIDQSWTFLRNAHIKKLFVFRWQHKSYLSNQIILVRLKTLRQNVKNLIILRKQIFLHNTCILDKKNWP